MKAPILDHGPRDNPRHEQRGVDQRQLSNVDYLLEFGTLILYSVRKFYLFYVANVPYVFLCLCRMKYMSLI